MSPQEEEINLQEEKTNPQEEKGEPAGREYNFATMNTIYLKFPRIWTTAVTQIRSIIINGSIFWLFAVPMSTQKKFEKPLGKLCLRESKWTKLRKKLEIYKILPGRGNISGPISPIYGWF